MDTNELIPILEAGLNNADLRPPILAVLALLRESAKVTIADSQTAGTSRTELLGIFRARQKHLSKRGIVIQGLDESVLSLSKCDSEKIHIVGATADDKWIAIWLAPSKAVVGCHFAKNEK